MFVVLMGLSMDYHVFVLSRIREGIRRGLTARIAVEVGVGETAVVVASAAAIMVSVFAIFATLSMLELKQIGVGLAVSVLSTGPLSASSCCRRCSSCWETSRGGPGRHVA